MKRMFIFLFFLGVLCPRAYSMNYLNAHNGDPHKMAGRTVGPEKSDDGIPKLINAAYIGNTVVCKMLLAQSPDLINKKNDRGQSVLSAAIEGAFTCRSFCFDSHIIDFLLTLRPDLSLMVSYKGNPLHGTVEQLFSCFCHEYKLRLTQDTVFREKIKAMLISLVGEEKAQNVAILCPQIGAVEATTTVVYVNSDSTPLTLSAWDFMALRKVHNQGTVNRATDTETAQAVQPVDIPAPQITKSTPPADPKPVVKTPTPLVTKTEEKTSWWRKPLTDYRIGLATLGLLGTAFWYLQTAPQPPKKEATKNGQESEVVNI